MKRGILIRSYIVCLMFSLAGEVHLFPIKVLFLESVHLSLLVIFIGVAFPVYYFRDFLHFIRERRYVILFVILFLLSGLVSVGFSPFPVAYGLKWLFQYGVFFGVSFELLFLFSLDRSLGPFFLKTVAGLALLLALISLFESANVGFYRFLSDTFRNGEYQMLGGRIRAGATLPHSNIFGCFMSVAILVFLYLRHRFGMKAKLFYPAVLLLCAGMALSGSRNAVFVLTLPLASLLFNGKTARTALAVIALAVLSLAVLTPSASRFLDVWKIAVEMRNKPMEGEKASGPLLSNSTGTRFELWRGALAMFRDRPILGMGPGGYNRALKDYASLSLLAVEKEKIEREFLNAHNGFLNVLAEFGAVGTGFGLVFVFYIVLRLVRRHGLFPPGPVHAVLLGLGVSFWPDAFYYSRFYMVVTVTLLLVLAFSMEDVSGSPATPAEKPES